MTGLRPRMVRGRWFVTGTDTDAGKTVVTAALAAAAAPNVLAAKPIATGVREGAVPDDAALLARSGGHAPSYFMAFSAPVSPHRASPRPIGPEAVVWTAALTADVLLVEGVGGWRVPLGGAWVTDLARAALGSGPGGIVIAAPDRVGVINQVLLTVEAIRRDGLPIVGVVLSRFPPTDPSVATNADDLTSLLDLPVATLERLNIQDISVLADAGRRVWTTLGVSGFNRRS